MSMRETVKGKCYRCDEVQSWRITHRFVDYHGICHCLQCTRCGFVVPEFAWSRYQQDGKVVIPV